MIFTLTKFTIYIQSCVSIWVWYRKRHLVYVFVPMGLGNNAFAKELTVHCASQPQCSSYSLKLVANKTCTHGMIAACVYVHTHGSSAIYDEQ